MRWLSSAMCLILLTASGFATTLTGTLRYPDKSLVNGKIVLTPSYPGRVSTDSSVFVPAQVEYPVTNGALPANAQVWGNDVIEPTGTYYIVQVYNRLGELKFQAPYVVSGATYNLGSAAMSSVTTTNVSFTAALTNVPNTWTALQTFNSGSDMNSVGIAHAGPLTGATLDAEGTGNSVTVPFKQQWLNGICQNTTTVIFWNLPTTNTPTSACGGGGASRVGVVAFTNSGLQSATVPDFLIPSDFTGTVDFRWIWWGGFTTGTVTWQFDAGCVALGTTATIGGPSFTTIWSPGAQAPNGTIFGAVTVATTGVSLPGGCTTGTVLTVKIKRTDTDATNTTANGYMLEMTYRRTM